MLFRIGEFVQPDCDHDEFVRVHVWMVSNPLPVDVRVCGHKLVYCSLTVAYGFADDVADVWFLRLWLRIVAVEGWRITDLARNEIKRPLWLFSAIGMVVMVGRR